MFKFNYINPVSVFFFLIIGLYIFQVGNQGEENVMLVFGPFNLSVFTFLKTQVQNKILY